MNKKLQEQTIRVLFSSLISSNFSKRDLYEISQSFYKDDGLIENLGRLLENFVSNIEYSSFNSNNSSSNDHYELTEDFVEEALTIVRNKRLSKNKFISLVNHFNDTYLIFDNNSSPTIREMLMEIFNKMSREEIYNFLDILGGKSLKSSDEYLDGIMSKREG